MADKTIEALKNCDQFKVIDWREAPDNFIAKRWHPYKAFRATYIALIAGVMLTLPNSAWSTNPKSAGWMLKSEQQVKQPSARSRTIHTVKAETLSLHVEPTSPKTPQAAHPAINDTSKLRETLRRQLSDVQKLEETADAFDERFSELYLAYGKSLLAAGEQSDAINMFKTALHNVKINNGVSGIEQRPVLRALFNAELAANSYLDAERNLKHLIWIDKHNPLDTYSLDLTIEMANYFLNQYLSSRKITEEGLVGLNKAIGYFDYTIQTYSDNTNRKNLPYGDFVYAHYLKTLAHQSVDPALFVEARLKSLASLNNIGIKRLSLQNSFSQSRNYLNLAYEQAKAAIDLNDTILALIQLGDLHILYNKHLSANDFYVQAHNLASDLPSSHPISVSFEHPVKLPAFKLTKNAPQLASRAYHIVPMIIDIAQSGRVESVSRRKDIEFPMVVRIQANKIAKNLRFRPSINREGLSPYSNHEYNIEVSEKIKPILIVQNSEE